MHLENMNKSHRLADQNGYRRAKAEAIRMVKRMEGEWDRPRPWAGPPDNPYAAISLVVARLKQLDPDHPLEDNQ